MKLTVCFRFCLLVIYSFSWICSKFIYCFSDSVCFSCLKLINISKHIVWHVIMLNSFQCVNVSINLINKSHIFFSLTNRNYTSLLFWSPSIKNFSYILIKTRLPGICKKKVCKFSMAYLVKWLFILIWSVWNMKSNRCSVFVCSLQSIKVTESHYMLKHKI